MTNDEMFSILVILTIILCMVLVVIAFGFKMYLYKKMKADGEEIQFISKRFAIAGMTIYIIDSIIQAIYIIELLNGYNLSTCILAFLGAALPYFFFSSIYFVGNKSVIIEMKRYFYSDIVKIENKSATYIITMTDGTVEKSSAMFGCIKLNEELRKILPELIVN